jgi:hypothetical protein
MKKKTRKQEEKEANEMICRALAVFIASQDRKLELPKFPINWTGFSILLMTGRNEEITEACKKFLNVAIPLLDKAE